MSAALDPILAEMMPGAAALLRTEDLTVRFGGLTALNRVNFAVERGEVRAIIGPNGAGKSTFFNCLTGVLRRSSGHTRCDGGDGAGASAARIWRRATAPARCGPPTPQRRPRRRTGYA